MKQRIKLLQTDRARTPHCRVTRTHNARAQTCEEEERERCTGKKAAAAMSRFLPCRRPAREFQRAFGQGKKGERDKGAVRVGKNRGECP